MTLIITLFVIGTGLVIAEAMFPSFGLLGLMAATAFIVAILEAFELGTGSGFTAIAVGLVLAPVAFFSGLRFLRFTPMGRLLLLEGPRREDVSGSGTDQSLEALRGRSGVASTSLRPSGIVDVDGRRIDAVSASGLIDPGTPVTITFVQGNRVVVEPLAREAG